MLTNDFFLLLLLEIITLQASVRGGYQVAIAAACPVKLEINSKTHRAHPIMRGLDHGDRLRGLQTDAVGKFKEEPARPPALPWN